METKDPNEKASNFIIESVAEDLKSGRFTYVRTRLPSGTEWVSSHRAR